MPTTKKTTTKATLTFKPKQVVLQLLSVLAERSQDVLESRYGLGKNTKPMTLEAIGKRYGITRERVRQIENYSLKSIRKSDVYTETDVVFGELRDLIDSLGGVVSEQEFLDDLSNDLSTRNQIHFLLVLGDLFVKHKEDGEFHHRWLVNTDAAEKVYGSLRRLYKTLSSEDLLPEDEMISSFSKQIKGSLGQYETTDNMRRWLNLSKKISVNPLGDWGKASSPNVNAKGIRDYAYLVIRRHGSPIHFREVAQAIGDVFDRKAHVATTHNELIKDKRFVLVGRGLYALSEWGYMNGVVKDVIAEILKTQGPLTRQEVIEKVLRERYVKEGTIVVNLQDPKNFKKDKEGRYYIVK
jgi:hypothetical protein